MSAPSPPRVGVFGGTFDPIHLGHLIVASELRYALALDRVLFVLAARPPHKPDQVLSSDADRLAMLRLALTGAPRFAISTVELDRPGPSFTADTLRQLATDLAPVQLVFLMGADSLRDLPTWHEPNRIATLAELGVAARPSAPLDPEAVLQAVPAARGKVRIVPVTPIGISSRELRRRVAAGEPIAYQVPRAVEAYIREHGLYVGDR